MRLVTSALYLAVGVVISSIAVAAPTSAPDAASLSAQRALFVPPIGLWVAPSDHSGKLYGPTSPSANWSVVQWNIPKDLPPFQKGVSQNGFARVEETPDHSYNLSQDAAAVSCNKTYSSGVNDVHELDLYLTPNNRNTPNYPQAIANGSANLAVSHIRHTIDVEPRSLNVVDTACSVTRAVFLTDVTLINPSHKQVLFYQLRLGMANMSKGKLSWTMPAPGWFFSGVDPRSGHGRSFGFDDSITAYGVAPVSLQNESKYSLDLLPRLIAVIRGGESRGLDQNLADWRIGGTYHGEIAWGHIRVSSRWKGFSLTIE